MNITGIDKCVGLAVQQSVVYGCVQRVRETILEHPRQFLVGQQFLYPQDFGFYGFRNVQSVFYGRAVGLVRGSHLGMVHNFGIVLF